MKQRFNFAYIPAFNQKKFVEVAQERALISKPKTYCLGPFSLPHVSLCHFITEEHLVHELWSQVEALKLPMLKLTFNTIRNKTYSDDSPEGGLICVSLIPNHIQELKEIHLKIAEIIKHPLNYAYENYDPHLTLLTTDKATATILPNESSIIHHPIADDFIIALGTLDEYGQITDIRKTISDTTLNFASDGR